MCLFGPPPAVARRTAPDEALPRSDCGPTPVPDRVATAARSQLARERVAASRARAKRERAAAGSARAARGLPDEPARDRVVAAAAGLARLRAAAAAESARKRGNPLVIVLPPRRAA